MSDDSEEIDWSAYESGPFCRHWGDPADCDIVCASCGHRCTRHRAEDGESECTDCECERWVEPDEEAKVTEDPYKALREYADPVTGGGPLPKDVRHQIISLLKEHDETQRAIADALDRLALMAQNRRG